MVRLRVSPKSILILAKPATTAYTNYPPFPTPPLFLSSAFLAPAPVLPLPTMSSKPRLMGAGLQMANRGNRNKAGSPKSGPPQSVGKSLSFRATAQVFYKYNSTEGDEQAVSPQVDFDRVIANSKGKKSKNPHTPNHGTKE